MTLMITTRGGRRTTVWKQNFKHRSLVWTRETNHSMSYIQRGVMFPEQPACSLLRNKQEACQDVSNVKNPKRGRVIVSSSITFYRETRSLPLYESRSVMD